LHKPKQMNSSSHCYYAFAAVSIGVVSRAIPGPIVELR
jgi:hypothetical protein